MTTPIYTAAVRAYCRDYVARLTAPLWRMVDRLDTAYADALNEPNPLAVGRFCGCGTRLESGHGCPMCGEAK